MRHAQTSDTAIMQYRSLNSCIISIGLQHLTYEYGSCAIHCLDSTSEIDPPTLSLRGGLVMQVK